jgi:hypothetical protein
MIRRAVRALGALLVGVAVVGACTSQGTDKSRQAVESALLQLSDFPPTWRAFTAPDQSPDLLGSIASCTGAGTTAKSDFTVHSQEFRNGQQRITSTAVAYSDPSNALKQANALSSPRADQCMARAVRPVVLALVPRATITSAKFDVRSGGVNTAVNQAGSATGTVTVSAGGRTEKAYLDVVFLLGTNYYSDITYLGLGKPVAGFIQNVLTTRVAMREQHS